MMPPKIMTKDPRVKVDRDRTPARPEAYKLSRLPLGCCDVIHRRTGPIRETPRNNRKGRRQAPKEQVKFQKLLAEESRRREKVHWREANLTMQEHEEQIAAQKATLEAEAEQAAPITRSSTSLLKGRSGENVDRRRRRPGVWS